MIAINKHTPPLTLSTVNRAIWILGLATLAALALLVLYALLWLIEEVFYAIAEVLHLISVANPLVLTGVLVVLAVWLVGKIKR